MLKSLMAGIGAAGLLFIASAQATPIQSISFDGAHANWGGTDIFTSSSSGAAYSATISWDIAAMSSTGACTTDCSWNVTGLTQSLTVGSQTVTYTATSAVIEYALNNGGEPYVSITGNINGGGFTFHFKVPSGEISSLFTSTSSANDSALLKAFTDLAVDTGFTQFNTTLSDHQGFSASPGPATVTSAVDSGQSGVPEPSTIATMLAGLTSLLAAAFLRRRRAFSAI